MAITTLYANGVLNKLTKKKPLTIVIGAIVIALVAVAVRFIVSIILIIGIALLESFQPAETNSGVEKYDKQYLLDEWSGELNTLFMIFPENLENAESAEYNYYLKSGMFDTDGYIILKARYSDEEFNKESDRISDISCKVCFKDEEFTSDIKYDGENYKYPAYVTNDGFDDAYEYALINKDENEIYYVVLSYPNALDLVKLNEYIKKNPLAYEIPGSSLDRFTIYSHKFDGNDWWDGAVIEDQDY